MEMNRSPCNRESRRAQDGGSQLDTVPSVHIRPGPIQSNLLDTGLSCAHTSSRVIPAQARGSFSSAKPVESLSWYKK